MMRHSAMDISLKHASLAIKQLRGQHELLGAYQLSPWLVYPLLVILRETVFGLRHFSFDWLGGHARLSVFEPGSITLSVAFTLAFCAGYVILYVRGPQKLPLVLTMSVAASIMYFGLEYFIVHLDLHLLPGDRNACVNSASGPYCLGYFELGMWMWVSVMVSINGCRWALQRLGNQTYSWELPTRPDMRNAGPLSGVRQGTAWGLISTAARFMVGALLLSFMIGILAGLAQSIWKLPQTDNFDLQLKIAAISTVETILLLAAIAAGRIVGAGSIKTGLGNKAVSKPLLMILLAIVLVAYEALATYLLFKLRPDLLLLEQYPSASPLLQLMFLLLAVGLAPVAEELFFRGWLWTGLRRQWNVLPAALLTSGFWLAMHFDRGWLVIGLVPGAIILSMAREIAGSVRAPIAIHSINNLVGIGLASLLIR